MPNIEYAKTDIVVNSLWFCKKPLGIFYNKEQKIKALNDWKNI